MRPFLILSDHVVMAPEGENGGCIIPCVDHVLAAESGIVEGKLAVAVDMLLGLVGIIFIETDPAFNVNPNTHRIPSEGCIERVESDGGGTVLEAFLPNVVYFDFVQVSARCEAAVLQYCKGIGDVSLYLEQFWRQFRQVFQDILPCPGCWHIVGAGPS